MSEAIVDFLEIVEIDVGDGQHAGMALGAAALALQHFIEGAAIEFTLSLPPDDVLHLPIRVNYVGKAIRVRQLTNSVFGVAAVMESYGFAGEA